MMEMTAEFNEKHFDDVHDDDLRGGLSGRTVISAGLLGLSIDEFGSRLRHSLHAGHKDGPPHVHFNAPTERTSQSENTTLLPIISATDDPLSNRTLNKDFIEAEKQILIGFFIFAAMYLTCSVLLLLASVYESSCMSVPWLVAHLGTVSAQTAVLVSQITAARSLAKNGPMDEPGHPLGAHIAEPDHASHVKPAAIVLSTVNLIWLIFMWTIVILATRLWTKRRFNATPVAASGDESYALSGDESFVYLETIK